MAQLTVTAKKLNKRKSIPSVLPDDNNIIGQVLKGFKFEGEKVGPDRILNPDIGSWYEDRDGHFYWGGGLKLDSSILSEALISDSTLESSGSLLTDSTKLGWGLKMLQIHEFWKTAGNRGDGIKIAVLDTGIVAAHPDFDYSRIVQHNILQNNQDATDTDGHGTHVAGIIAAKGLKVTGAAPNVQLLIIKIAEKETEWLIENVINGIQHAMDQNAEIISISGEFHKRNPKLELLRDKIKQVRQKGIVLVASAGNNFSNIPIDNFPASFDECISVGSIKIDRTRADHSSLSTKLDLVAPGDSIESTWIGNGYKTKSGTSMATPMVAGIVAVLKSFARNKKQKELSPDEIYIHLTKSADDTNLGDFNTAYGFGIVNPNNTLQAL